MIFTFNYDVVIGAWVASDENFNGVLQYGMGWDGMVCLILWCEWDMGLGGDPIELGWDGIKLRMGLN